MVYEYTAPKLTRYGKVTEFIEAGSVQLATGDVTGDGVADTLFDTNNDRVGDLVVGGANGGETPVQRTNSSGFSPNDSYDGDGDGIAGIRSRRGRRTLFRVTSRTDAFEPAADDGWDDPARD